MMFAPQKRDFSWWERFTRSGKKVSKKFFEGIIEKYDDKHSFFHGEVTHLESSLFSILAESEVTHCFVKNPSFKKDLGFCMPFYNDVFEENKDPLHIVNYKRIHEASRFIDKIVPDQSIDLAILPRKELVQSMKQHSLFQ